MTRRRLPIMLFFTALGCGDDPEAQGSFEVELCEHMQEGPSQAITASSSTTASPPDITVEHTRLDITLPASGAGFVLFEASSSSEYVFALNDDVAFRAWDASDPSSAIPIEHTEQGSELCSEVVVQHFLDLDLGQVYLELGPGTSVGLVFEDVGELGDGHEH